MISACDGVATIGPSMFKKTVHPLDLLLAVLAAAMPGAAIFYWLARRGGLPFDFLTGLAGLVAAVEVHASPLAQVASDHLPLKARIDISAALEGLQRTGGPSLSADRAIAGLTSPLPRI